MNRNPTRALLCLHILIWTPAAVWAQAASDPSLAALSGEPAQQQQPEPAPAQAPAATPQNPADQAAQEQEQTPPSTQPPKPEPLPPPKYTPSNVNTGRGFSIEPFYWLGSVQPRLRPGKQNIDAVPTSLDYPRAKPPVYGGILSIPVSKTSMIRISYFQTSQNDGVLAPADGVLFSQSVSAGNPIAISYKIENFKLSYDYLTYFWTRGNSEFRVKTLWGAQYVGMSNSFAIFSPNEDGTYNVNSAFGDKSLFYPTFGLALENTLGRHVRWEAMASGFAWPKKSVLGDMEADIAFRAGHLELVIGGRAYHFKTSPQKDDYYSATLFGPYAGLRFYWKKR